MSLSDTQIQKFKSKDKVYRKLDKDGLYLEVAVSGTKSWIHRYSFNNKSTMRVIGHYDNKSMSLRSAREELLDDKKLLGRGVNPKDVKGKNKNKSTSVGATFKDVFFEWHKLQSNGWSPASSMSPGKWGGEGTGHVCVLTLSCHTPIIQFWSDSSSIVVHNKVDSLPYCEPMTGIMFRYHRECHQEDEHG